MATYQIYAYSTSALDYNSSTGAFELSADYDPKVDRILVTITDDDTFFDGDTNANEIGSDANQTAVVTTYDGTVIASGKVYDEAYAEISTPAGGTAFLDRIEIGGVRLGYFSTEPLVPGESYPVVFTEDVTSSPDNRMIYSELQSVPCFGAGTRIATSDGEVPVEWLTRGDRVLTRDHGYQPVLWVGRFAMSSGVGGRPAEMVEVAARGMGRGLPLRRMRLTGNHRVLLSGPEVELNFGVTEALASAGHLAGTNGITRRACQPGQLFYHILLQEHEVILSDGIWTESLLASDMVLECQPQHVQRHIRNVTQGHHVEAARTCLRKWEVTLLRARRGNVAAVAAA
jgi:hypothetical protein